MALWAGRGNATLRHAIESELLAAHGSTKGGAYFSAQSANGISFSRGYVSSNTPVDELEMLGALLRFYDELAPAFGGDEAAIYREMVSALGTPCDSYTINYSSARP